MPKNNKAVNDVEQAYMQVERAFNKFKKSFNKDMTLVLSEDADKITQSLDKFKNMILEWNTNEHVRSIGQDSFVGKLNADLEDIISAHRDLATRANTMKTPSVVQNIKSYLSVAVESITNLCAAVANFVGNLSQKTTNAISTSFNSFRESIRNIKLPSTSGSGNRPEKM